MLAKDVGRIIVPRNMVEANDLARNRLTYAVKGQCHMTLVEFCMRRHGTINNRLVVSKHVALVADRNSKVSKSRA